MQQWYNCPGCNQWIQYGQPHCQQCGYRFQWQVQEDTGFLSKHWWINSPTPKIVILFAVILFFSIYAIVALNNAHQKDLIYQQSLIKKQAQLDTVITQIKPQIEQSAGKYVEIDSIDKEAGYIRIYINLKYTDELYSNLEDGYKMAEMWTRAVAESVIILFNKNDIEMGVNVWAKMPVGDGKSILFGVTRFNNGSYVWERYKK